MREGESASAERIRKILRERKNFHDVRVNLIARDEDEDAFFLPPFSLTQVKFN